MIYADTSFLVSAYAYDVNRAAAVQFLEENKPSLPFCFLHWPEVAKAFWTIVPEPESLWERVQEDLAGERKLFLLESDANIVARRSAGLLKHFCPRWKKLRSLDALHVSAAIEGGFKTFLSFDMQSFQRVLASTQKLKVWPPLTKEELAHLK